MRTNSNKLLWCLLVGLMLLLLAGCGGGGSDDDDSNTDDNTSGGSSTNVGGDPKEPVTFIRSLPRFDNVKGVAVSDHFLYVADAGALYAFTRLGMPLNQVASPAAPNVGCVVIPTEPDPIFNDPDYQDKYLLAGYIAVLHQPSVGSGIVSIYPPNLNTDANAGDDPITDIYHRIDLPRYPLVEEIYPNAATEEPPATTYDGQHKLKYRLLNPNSIAADKFGKLWVKCSVTTDYGGIWPTALLIFDPLRGGDDGTGRSIGYQCVFNPTGLVNWQLTEDDDDGGSEPRTITYTESPPAPGPEAPPFYSQAFGNNTGRANTAGDAGTRAYIDFQDNPQFYAIDSRLNKDYIGVSVVENDFSKSPPIYSIPPRNITNFWNWDRVIGERSGSGPGEFARDAPFFNDGTPVDIDVMGGGPTNMAVDPNNNDLYICDPGNRRIQVFDKNGTFKKILAGGSPNVGGSSALAGMLMAPSSVAIDRTGNVYVGDIDEVKIFNVYRTATQFGNLEGVVYAEGTDPKFGDVPIVGATIIVSDGMGIVSAIASDNQGRFEFNNLPIGVYSVSATYYNYDNDSASVRILPNETIKVIFALKPFSSTELGSYSGYVYDKKTQLNLSGVEIGLAKPGASTEFMKAYSRGDGYFSMGDIKAGPYIATFRREGYASVTRQVNITQGQNTLDIVSLSPL